MSDFTDEKVGCWAQSLTDELSPEEKIQIWNQIKEHRGLPDSSAHSTRTMKRALRYGWGVGTVIGGLVATCLIVLSIFYPPASNNPQFTEGAETASGTSGPSFIVAHLNMLYIIMSVVLFAFCVWRMIRLFVSTHGEGIRWFSAVNVGGKRRWMVITLLVLGLAVSSLEVVDQYQGGPLGREYSPGATESLTMRTGQSMLLIPIPLVDRTLLPIHVISVKATSDVSGLTISGGITKNPPALGGIIAPTAAEEQFIRGTVTIPSESHNVGGDHFVPVFKVAGTEPGYYAINGFTVIYRWGPIVYRTKLLPVVVWYVTVK
jgi:hypothetical protein